MKFSEAIKDSKYIDSLYELTDTKSIRGKNIGEYKIDNVTFGINYIRKESEEKTVLAFIDDSITCKSFELSLYEVNKYDDSKWIQLDLSDEQIRSMFEFSRSNEYNEIRFIAKNRELFICEKEFCLFLMYFERISNKIVDTNLNKYRYIGILTNEQLEYKTIRSLCIKYFNRGYIDRCKIKNLLIQCYRPGYENPYSNCFSLMSNKIKHLELNIIKSGPLIEIIKTDIEELVINISEIKDISNNGEILLSTYSTSIKRAVLKLTKEQYKEFDIENMSVRNNIVMDISMNMTFDFEIEII